MNPAQEQKKRREEIRRLRANFITRAALPEAERVAAQRQALVEFQARYAAQRAQERRLEQQVARMKAQQEAQKARLLHQAAAVQNRRRAQQAQQWRLMEAKSARPALPARTMRLMDDYQPQPAPRKRKAQDEPAAAAPQKQVYVISSDSEED